MADDEIKFSGNADQLLKEYEKLEEKDRKREESLKKGAKAAKESAREQAALERQAARIREKSLTDMQRHEKALQKLETLKKRQILTEKEYLAAVAKEKEEYRKNTTEFKDAQQKKEKLKQKEMDLTKKAAQENKKFNEEGKRLSEQARTPLQKYNAEVEKLNRQLKAGNINVREHSRLVKQARNDYRGATQGAGKWDASIARVAGAIGVGGILMRGFAIWKQANQEIIDQAGEIGKAYDESIRKFSVQTGLKGLELEEADNSILNIADKNAVDSEKARSVATQLVSSGFSATEASGGSLDKFLQILQASNANGQNFDAAELAKSLTQFLSANDLEKNEENVETFGVGVQRLFKARNQQLSGLTALAGASSAVSKQITPAEQLSAFSAMVDVLGEAEASTGLRQTVGRLGGAAANPGRVKALKEIGLSPEDVDFVDEDFATVLERVKEGIDNLPKGQRKAQTQAIFGERGEIGAAVLMQNVEAIREGLEIQKDTEGFASDVKIATTGRNAAATRQEIAKERQLVKRDSKDDLFISEIENQLLADDRSPLEVDLTKRVFKASRSLNVPSETSANLATSLSTATKDTIFNKIDPFGFRRFLGPQEPGITGQSVSQGVSDAESGANSGGNPTLEKALNDNTKATKDNSRRTSRADQAPQLGADRRNRGQ